LQSEGNLLNTFFPLHNRIRLLLRNYYTAIVRKREAIIIF
jgi:hypothetical protein